MDFGKYEWIKYLPKTALEEMAGYLATVGTKKPSKESLALAKAIIPEANSRVGVPMRD